MIFKDLRFVKTKMGYFATQKKSIGTVVSKNTIIKQTVFLNSQFQVCSIACFYFLEHFKMQLFETTVPKKY